MSARSGRQVDNLREFMLAAADSTPDKPAVLETAADGGLQAVSYQQLRERTDRYVAVLAELGLDVGDRVILQSHTSADAIAAVAACATLGLPFIPISPDTPAKRLLAIAEIAEPALFLQAAEGGREDIPLHLGAGQLRPRWPDRRATAGAAGPAPAGGHGHRSGVPDLYVGHNGSAQGRGDEPRGESGVLPRHAS